MGDPTPAPLEESSLEMRLEEGEPLALDALLTLPIFQGVPQPLLEKNRAGVVLRHFRRGEIICREGEQGSTAFYILNGSVRVSIAAPFVHVKTASERPWRFGLKGLINKMTSFFVGHQEDPRPEDRLPFIPIDAPVDLNYEQPVAQLGPGSLFGEMTCLSFYPRSATVIAEEDCDLLEMLQNILQICQRNPEFKKRLDDDYRQRAMVTHLQSVPLFRSLPDSVLSELKEQAELISVEPGERIFAEGDSADALYLVRLGFVKVSKRLPGGEMVLSYLPKGSYFGEMGILQSWDDERRSSRRVPFPLNGTLEWQGGAGPAAVQLFDLSADGVRVESSDIPQGVQGTLSLVVVMEGEPRTLKLAVTSVWSQREGRPEVGLKFGDRCQGDREVLDKIYQQYLPTSQRTASCTALDHVELVKIRSGVILDLMEKFPKIVTKMREMAVGREATNRYLMTVPREVPLDDFLDQGLIQAQNLLILDLNKCTRCDACTEACAATHDGVTRLIREGLRYDHYLVATSCRQCMDPLCMVGCPVGSIRRKESLEILIEDWCIGCGLCARNCPYGNINMQPYKSLEEEASLPGVKKAVLRKKATTCDLCTDLEEPSCVYACPHEAAHRVDPKQFFTFHGSRSSSGS